MQEKFYFGSVASFSCWTRGKIELHRSGHRYCAIAAMICTVMGVVVKSYLLGQVLL